MTPAAEHFDIGSSTCDEPCSPLFVLSVWRSGSSLLYALLNQHSKIALLYEGDLPRLHLYLFGRFHNGTWRERWEFWNRGPSRHGLAVELLPTKVSNAWEATRAVYQEVARRKQATVWGEKTPHWYDCPLYMAEQFPDARFIFLWRDVNAVISSVGRAAPNERFFRKAGFAYRIFVGIEKLKDACEALKRRGRPVHEVNYEDLTSTPSECMREICHFLDLPFEVQIASLQGSDTSAIAQGQHHKMVRGDRIISSGRDKSVLAPALRTKIERYVTRWSMQHAGRWPQYPVEQQPGATPVSRLELWCDRMVYSFFHTRDKMVALIYALVPISMARALRLWIRQRGNLIEPIVTSE